MSASVVKNMIGEDKKFVNEIIYQLHGITTELNKEYLTEIYINYYVININIHINEMITLLRNIKYNNITCKNILGIIALYRNTIDICNKSEQKLLQIIK